MKTKVKRDEELKSLCSFKTYSGLLGYANYLGLLLIIIGLLCPYCYYNSTILDITKQVVHFWDLSFIYVAVTIICILFAFGLSEIVKYLTNWRTRKKFYIISTIVVVLLICIAYIVQTIGCVFYEIPNQELSMLVIEFDAGFYLYTVGSCIFMLTNTFFIYFLIKVINGKTTIEVLTFVKDGNTIKEDKTTQTNEDVTLTEKLEELKNLKDNGIITEDEYQTKKANLLDNFN